MLTPGECPASAHPRPSGPVDSLIFEMFLTGRMLRAAFERVVGISQSRLMLLGLAFVSGEISQSDLQRHLDVDGAVITRLVKQLEAEGYLSRRPDPADNRFTLVALTPAGREKLQDVQEKGQALLASAIHGIDENDLASMRRLLERVRNNIGGQGPVGPRMDEYPEAGSSKLETGN